MTRGTTFACLATAPIENQPSNAALRHSLPGNAIVLLYRQPPGFSPYGIPWAQQLAPSQVRPLLQALAAGHRLWDRRRVQAAEGLKFARGLLKSGNYFLFALGVWETARYGSKVDLKLLVQMLVNARAANGSAPQKNLLKTGLIPPPLPAGTVGLPGVLSERRAVWLYYCLREVAPKGRRPSARDVDWAFEGYLKRMLSPESATFIRWPGQRYK